MLRKIPPVSILFVILGLIFLANFSSNWLTGWDNLHPEFNFGLNIKRSIFAVWQEYQGPGLLGGNGHASDLSRQISLLALSFVFPDNSLRQIYSFLMLLLGPLGVYFLLKRVVLAKLERKPREVASVLGGLFYLLNLATVQNFFVPFEPFLIHYGFLPWLFLVAFELANRFTYKFLLFFVILNFLAAGQGYVPTVFLVYLFALSGSLFILVLQHQTSIKKSLGIFVLTIIVNAFWFLPFLYFLFNNSSVAFESKMNQMATETNFLKNREFGDLLDVIQLKGFWFNNTDFNSQRQLVDMMELWRNYVSSPAITIVGILLFLFVILGIIISFKHKHSYRFVLIFLFLTSFTLIANNTLPFSLIDSLLYKFPIFAQAFRFPFTKLSVLAAFSYSLFFAIGIGWLLTKYNRKAAITAISIILPICLCFPVLQGHLFYDKERVDIPSEYFQLFEFFQKKDKNTRIADFPQHSLWGWNFYNWGYGGSGFLWYGIEQPILDRAFDPWSGKNENYYWELSYALYSKNPTLFESVLEKYQINWILVDENVVNPSSPKALFYDETREILSESRKIELAQTFGKIKIYKVNLETPVHDFVYIADNLPTVGPVYKWNNYDAAYAGHGNYISECSMSNVQCQMSKYYPYRSLFTGRDQKELEFEVEEKGDYFAFGKKLPAGSFNYVVQVPTIKKEDLMWVNPDDLAKAEYLLRDIYLTSNSIEVKIPKVGGYFGADLSAVNDLKETEAKNCDNRGNGSVKNEIIKEGTNEYLRLIAKNSTNCSASFYLPNLPHNLGYLITVESRNVKGKSPVFWLENLNSRKSDIETRLPAGRKVATSYFVQPPMETDGVGYTIHIDNASIGSEEAINDVGDIKVYPLPYRFLTDMVMTRDGVDVPQASHTITGVSHLGGVKVAHPNPSWYEVTLQQSSGQAMDRLQGTVVLSQAYDPGWHAYQCQMSNFKCQILPMIFGKDIKNHVLVNNWENGWNISECPMSNVQCQIKIVYLPQYLEYFGFTLLGLFISGILLSYKFNHRIH